MLFSVVVYCMYLMFVGFVIVFLVRNGLVSELLNVMFVFVDICIDVFWKNMKFR